MQGNSHRPAGFPMSCAPFASYHAARFRNLAAILPREAAGFWER